MARAERVRIIWAMDGRTLLVFDDLCRSPMVSFRNVVLYKLACAEVLDAHIQAQDIELFVGSYKLTEEDSTKHVLQVCAPANNEEGLVVSLIICEDSGPPDLITSDDELPDPVPERANRLDSDSEAELLHARSQAGSGPSPRCAHGPCTRPVRYLCTRCRTTGYCSKKCQKKHWRSEHRNVCLSLSPDESPDPVPQQHMVNRPDSHSEAEILHARSQAGSGPTPRCAHGPCTRPVRYLCARCRTTGYCSKKCQTKHWRREHRNECVYECH